MAIEPARVKALFQAAIGLADPGERGAFLDREAGGDAELLGRLDALLAAFDRPPSALDRPLGDDSPTMTAAGPVEPQDLPPPSPLKAWLRSAKSRTVDGLIEAMGDALRAVRAGDIRGWFAQSGYGGRPSTVIPNRKLL